MTICTLKGATTYLSMIIPELLIVLISQISTKSQIKLHILLISIILTVLLDTLKYKNMILQ